MNWQEGEKYTVIGVGSMMAMTFKHEITCKGINPIDNEPIWVAKGKRKKQLFREPIGREMLVFKGWNIPLKIDSEAEPERTGTGMTSMIMCGNACFNFLGTPGFVRVR